MTRISAEEGGASGGQRKSSDEYEGDREKD